MPLHLFFLRLLISSLYIYLSGYGNSRRGRGFRNSLPTTPLSRHGWHCAIYSCVFLSDLCRDCLFLACNGIGKNHRCQQKCRLSPQPFAPWTWSGHQSHTTKTSLCATLPDVLPQESKQVQRRYQHSVRRADSYQPTKRQTDIRLCGA